MESNINNICGVKSLTNCIALGIIIDNNGAKAKVVNMMGNSIYYNAARWQSIKFNKNNDPYVIYHNCKHYLCDFMRVS